MPRVFPGRGFLRMKKRLQRKAGKTHNQSESAYRIASERIDTPDPHGTIGPDRHTEPLTHTRRIRIVSANIQHGKPAEPLKNHGSLLRTWVEHRRRYKAVLEEIGQMMADLHADIVCIQELDTRVVRSFFLDELGIIARAMRARYACRGLFFHSLALMLRVRPWYALHPKPPLIGGYGVGVISRLPVVAWKWLPLGAAPVGLPKSAGAGLFGSGRRLRLGQARALLAADVMVGQRVLRVGSTHLELHKETARHQLEHSCQMIRENHDTWALCGDFNLSSMEVASVLSTELFDNHHEEHLTERSCWDITTATFPADQPRHDIDHVVVPKSITPVSVRSVRMPGSDHQALIADIEIYDE